MKIYQNVCLGRIFQINTNVHQNQNQVEWDCWKEIIGSSNRNQIVITFLQFAHWTFTPSPSSLSNFLEPQSGHMGHALAGFIVERRCQLYEQC